MKVRSFCGRPLHSGESAAVNQARLGGLEALPLSLFCLPVEVVAPDLIGCRLVKRQTHGSLLWGVIVETEAYSQGDPAMADGGTPPVTKYSLWVPAENPVGFC